MEYEVDDDEVGHTNGEDVNSVDVELVTGWATGGGSGGIVSPPRRTYNEDDTSMMMANALLNLNKGRAKLISRAQYETTMRDEETTTMQEEKAVPDAATLEDAEIEKLQAQIAQLQAALKIKTASELG